MPNLTSLNINYDSIFVRLCSRDQEHGSELLLRALICCPRVNRLSCFGIPITEDIVKQLLVKKRLQKFCFNTVAEGSVCLVSRLLQCCACLVEVSIPQFVIVVNNYGPSTVRLWDFPRVSGSFKYLDVGGFVRVDLEKHLNSPLAGYANRPRDGSVLELVGRQLDNLLNFRQLIKLHLPYSNMDDSSIVRILENLKHLEDLDITGCFNLSSIGYRQLRFIKNLKYLSVGFLPITFTELESIDNLEFLGVSRCMVCKIDLLRLILRLNSLKRLVIVGTVSYRIINFKIKAYFENELPKFIRDFPGLGREVVIYYEDFVYDYWVKLGSVGGVHLSRICGIAGCPDWYVEEAAYSLWLTLNRRVINIVKELHM